MKSNNIRLFITGFVVCLFLVTLIGTVEAARGLPGDDPPPTTTTYRVYGYAKDADTYGVLSGATVKIYRGSIYLGSTTTSSTGYFNFYYTSSLSISSFTAKISKSGYYPVTTTKSVLDSRCYMGSVYLTPVPPIITYNVKGLVLDEDTNLPVENGILEIWTMSLQIGSAITDEDGEYDVDISTSVSVPYIRVEFELEGYDDAEVSVSSGSPNFVLPTLKVWKMYIIQGTTLANAQVEIQGLIDGIWAYLGTETTITDDTFAFTHNRGTVLEGVKIFVSKSGYETTMETLLGEELTYNFGSISLSGDGYRRYAVIVGVSDYHAAGVSVLSYCDEDANDWYNYLIGSMLYTADNVWVFGDNHPENYDEYSGLATEYNVKTCLNDLMKIANSNDDICFITAGHGGAGSTSGESFLFMYDYNLGENNEDGKLWDTEIASIFSSCSADNVFMFFDNCHSGGIGPDIMALSNSANFLVLTACTADGAGVDWNGLDEAQNGQFTYKFLEQTLISHYQSVLTTSLEDAFAYVMLNKYNLAEEHPDRPQIFDGDELNTMAFYQE